MGNTAKTETLRVAEEHFTSSVELVWAESWQAVVVAGLHFKSKMTEALSAEVFKRPVLWDH